MRQFLKVEKKRLEGCSAHTTHLPMAKASAVVVATCAAGGRGGGKLQMLMRSRKLEGVKCRGEQ